MQTYEYKCLKCNRKFEVFQNIKEKEIKVCPKCKGKVKRLISTGVGFIFKGSGFYATDYKVKPKKVGKYVEKKEKIEIKKTQEK